MVFAQIGIHRRIRSDSPDHVSAIAGQTLPNTRAGLSGLSRGTSHGKRPDHVALVNAKRMFRSRFSLELSGTSFGHSCVSNLLRERLVVFVLDLVWGCSHAWASALDSDAESTSLRPGGH